METTTAPARSTERPPALDAATMCEAFQITASAHPDRPALRLKGDEASYTWGEYAEHVRRVAAGLAALGVKKGETVALMLVNRPEFHLADAGAMHLGAVGYSIYNTYIPEQIEFLVRDAANRVLITEQAFLERVLAVRDSVETLEHVVVVDGEGGDGVLTLGELERLGDEGFDFDAAWKAVTPDDLLTLIYTSGTTGPPKGVQLTHGNLTETVRSYDRIAGFPHGGKVVSYLPMAHIAERNVSHYLPMMLGFTVTCCPNPREVIEFFHALGVPLAELWGMSETTGAGTCNPPERIKIGTVGPPGPGIEVKLADDGEVLIRGPVVMVGYRGQPEKTRETFTEDGFLKTGDIGELDEDGYLRIVDRKKELIISAAGKNMSPANIESKLKAAGPLIGQAIAVGDRRPYHVALITLDPDAIPHFCRERGIEDCSPEALAENPEVIQAVEREVARANEQLSRPEQIKRFRILPTDWEPGGDELTPTMKLKRKPIADKYADEIEALYSS